jgi:CRP-like cAMP-binding protein
MATADFLDQKRTEIGSRLKELQPLVDEYQRLEAAATALDSLPTASTSAAATGSARQGLARTRTPARKRDASHGRRGRPKGSGKRAQEALALVKTTPGITIPEMAQKMGISQNYLYRVLPRLAEDGLVSKEGREWHPAQTA